MLNVNLLFHGVVPHVIPAKVSLSTDKHRRQCVHILHHCVLRDRSGVHSLPSYEHTPPTARHHRKPDKTVFFNV